MDDKEKKEITPITYQYSTENQFYKHADVIGNRSGKKKEVVESKPDLNIEPRFSEKEIRKYSLDRHMVSLCELTKKNLLDIIVVVSDLETAPVVLEYFYKTFGRFPKEAEIQAIKEIGVMSVCKLYNIGINLYSRKQDTRLRLENCIHKNAVFVGAVGGEYCLDCKTWTGSCD